MYSYEYKCIYHKCILLQVTATHVHDYKRIFCVQVRYAKRPEIIETFIKLINTYKIDHCNTEGMVRKRF